MSIYHIFLTSQITLLSSNSRFDHAKRLLSRFLSFHVIFTSSFSLPYHIMNSSNLYHHRPYEEALLSASLPKPLISALAELCVAGSRSPEVEFFSSLEMPPDPTLTLRPSALFQSEAAGGCSGSGRLLRTSSILSALDCWLEDIFMADGGESISGVDLGAMEGREQWERVSGWGLLCWLACEIGLVVLLMNLGIEEQVCLDCFCDF